MLRFDRDRLQFSSRRSTVMAPSGAVATSQPLAAQAGLATLKKGGNAVDAALATAAVLNVVEPGMTGIGGDLFAIVYDSDKDALTGLNASGWSPQKGTIEAYKGMDYKEIPLYGVLSIIVPGALAGWDALRERFGTFSFKEILDPAIKYARNGFPVSERVSWTGVEDKLAQYPGGEEYLVNGLAPKPGERFCQRNLASTFDEIAGKGAEAFYSGELSKKIAGFLKKHGSLLEEEDLNEFKPEWVQPLSVDYEDYTLYELPPNGQGICALEALEIASCFDLEEFSYNSSEYLHVMIESMKLAFADGHHYVTDPRFREIPVHRLTSKAYCQQRGGLISDKAMVMAPWGVRKSDTVYLTVVDQERNMVSLINSIYRNFGSGVVVKGTGIVLQNRGSSFNLDENHSNCLEPRKRPYHTIIPAMMFRDGEPYMSFGVVGGHMQPQGHLQVVSNILNFKMNPQDALDAPRFRFEEGNRVLIEDSIPAKVIRELDKRGHSIEVRNHFSTEFGGGQITLLDPRTGYIFAGSDPRKDGCALGY